MYEGDFVKKNNPYEAIQFLEYIANLFKGWQDLM